MKTEFSRGLQFAQKIKFMNATRLANIAKDAHAQGVHAGYKRQFSSEIFFLICEAVSRNEIKKRQLTLFDGVRA